MLRKNIRLRREYIYNMESEKRNKKKFEQKMQIKNAIMENKNIPTEIYKQSDTLKKELQSNDDNTIVPRSHIDDEYASSIYREPLLLLTTCRDPSSRLLQFTKEMCLIFPNSLRINRGHYVIKDMVKLCQQKNVTDLIILHEHRGEPDGMIISHFPLGPTLYVGIQNCVLRHDLKEKIDTVSLAYPHLIFQDFSSNLGKRITDIFKHLFPCPKQDSKKVITFVNNHDIISLRHHQYDKVDYKTVELHELGPRFEMKPYQISLGLIDQTEATKEWVLRPYMNTANKQNLL